MKLYEVNWWLVAGLVALVAILSIGVASFVGWLDRRRYRRAKMAAVSSGVMSVNEARAKVYELRRPIPVAPPPKRLREREIEDETVTPLPYQTSNVYPEEAAKFSSGPLFQTGVEGGGGESGGGGASAGWDDVSSSSSSSDSSSSPISND